MASTIPADGALAHGGLIPSLIEWQAAVLPAANMHEAGCLLLREAFHPVPALLPEELGRLGLNHVLTVSALRGATQPYLVARIETPAGQGLLGG